MKILAILGILLAIIPVMGGTTVDTTWGGSGSFETHFTAGDDATSDFWTGGSVISGEWHATDNDDDPYSYGVDSVEAKVKAHTENGFIEYKFNRNDAKTSYGDAGQESYTFIGIGTGFDTSTPVFGIGTGDFAWKSTSNYASLKNCNYGWQANEQIQATGNQYVYHSFFIDDLKNEGAEIRFVGNADTVITDMNEDHGSSSYRFGKGCGCYTNANVDIDGSGTFDLNAWADNSIVTDTGITTDGFLNIHSAFNNGFHYDNFALEGN